MIGGSLAARCRKAFPKARIIGVSRSRQALLKAKKKDWICAGYADLRQAASHSKPNLIILCTPVDTLKGFLSRIDRVAPRGTIVTDAGSVKGFLVRWAERRKWRSIQYVGAHPMAGSHERGIDHARADLFDQTLTFVTPGKNSHPSATRRVIHFWKKISNHVKLISAEKHDQVTAEISHFPHLAATLLVDNVKNKSLSFASTGFLDTTRIASSDPGLWTPILIENRKELLKALQGYEKRLKRVKNILQKSRIQALYQILRSAQRRRKETL